MIHSKPDPVPRRKGEINYEKVRAELTKIAYAFADACVEKAILRTKDRNKDPEPWVVLGFNYLRYRLAQEQKEWEELLRPDKYLYPSLDVGATPEMESSELTDIGNMAAWIWWKHKNNNRGAEGVWA